MNKGLLTLDDTAHYTSLGRATIDRDSNEGRFPLPVRHNDRKYWRKKDVDKWIDDLPTQKAEPKKETRGRKRLAV